MPVSTLEQLFLVLDVSVDALAICDLAAGRRLIASAGEAIIIHYVLDGVLYLDVEGHEPMRCEQGSIVIVPPKTLQAISASASGGVDTPANDYATVAEDGLIMVDVAAGDEADLRFACGGVSANVPGLLGLFEPGSAPLIEPLADVEFVAQAFKLMLREMASRQVGARALSAALMKACLLLMIRRRLDRGDSSMTNLGALHGTRLGGVMKAVLERPELPHSVATLASCAGMSRSRFAKEFVAAFGMTPMTFVTKSRLHRAAERLQSSKAPIKAIAAAMGFQSRSHFSRAFSAAYGVDPTTYRREA